MPTSSAYIRVPANGWLSLAAVSGVALVTSNPWLTLLSLWILPMFVVLLWRRYEPPILLFATMVQWAEVSTKIFHADVLNISVTDLFADAVIVESILRGLTGLIIMAVGMRLALKGLPPRRPREMWREGSGISIVQTWYLYLGAFALSLAFQGFIWLVPGLTQILLPLFNLKWIFFFLLAYTVFLKQRQYWLLWLTVGLEVLIGFSGYFSGFKQVFFVLAVAYMSIGVRLRGRRLAFVGAITIMVVALGIVWMTIREDYRFYVNAGTGMQVVRVSMEERLSKLANLLSSADPEDFVKGAEKLATRVAYVDMFAYVLKRVPDSVPHEDGRLWGRAIRHVLMPRIIFPEKARLRSDSEMSMFYTGLALASAAQGTSISMGYMVESYIDFGPVFMYVPIFLLGTLWGGMYRYFVTRGPPTLLGYSVAVAVLINANQFGMYTSKLLGSMLMSFIVMVLLLRFVLPYLWGWIASPHRIVADI